MGTFDVPDAVVRFYPSSVLVLAISWLILAIRVRPGMIPYSLKLP